jgi:hypothetical protein
VEAHLEGSRLNADPALARDRSTSSPGTETTGATCEAAPFTTGGKIVISNGLAAYVKGAQREPSAITAPRAHFYFFRASVITLASRPALGWRQ